MHEDSTQLLFTRKISQGIRHCNVVRREAMFLQQLLSFNGILTDTYWYRYLLPFVNIFPPFLFDVLEASSLELYCVFLYWSYSFIVCIVWVPRLFLFLCWRCFLYLPLPLVACCTGESGPVKLFFSVSPGFLCVMYLLCTGIKTYSIRFYSWNAFRCRRSKCEPPSLSKKREGGGGFVTDWFVTDWLTGEIEMKKKNLQR